MKLLSFDNIQKKDIPLHYRNEYTARARFGTSSGLNWANNIFFSIEMQPTGKKEIKIEFLDQLDYPLIPMMRVLREEINTLDRQGKLL
jgi:hypothetical protein